MKPSRKSRSKNVKKSQDARDSKNVKKLQDVRDKSLSKICDFFKVSEETPNPTVKTDEINNNVTANPKQFYVKELTKRISKNIVIVKDMCRRKVFFFFYLI